MSPLAKKPHENMTLKYLRANRPDLADMVDAGVPVREAFRRAIVEANSMTGATETADRLKAGEAVRAYVDVQRGGAAHMPFEEPEGASMRIMKDANAPAPAEEMRYLARVGKRVGLVDPADTGDGITMTDFSRTERELSGAQFDSKMDALAGNPDYQKTQSVSVDGFNHRYEEARENDVGSGAATRRLLQYLDAAPPEVLRSLDENPNIPRYALFKLERDVDWSRMMGVARQDIQNARRIIGEGPGWIVRLREALASGALLPAIGAVLLGPAILSQGGNEEQ